MRKHDVIHKTGSTYITNRTAVMGKPNPRPSLTRENFFFNLHARGQTETDRDAHHNNPLSAPRSRVISSVLL